jgi:hypothetical protein
LAPKLPLLQKQFDSVDLRWTKQVTLHQKSKPAQAGDTDPAKELAKNPPEVATSPVQQDPTRPGLTDNTGTQTQSSSGVALQNPTSSNATPHNR